MAEVLHEDQTMKVVVHEYPGAETVIVCLQSRREPKNFLPPGKFPPPFVPIQVVKSGIPAHFVSFLVNRNSWYLGAEVEAVASLIRARFPTERLVTYGSSMGGYAAINLAPVLRADYAVALSPLSTLFPPYVDLIGDTRFSVDRPGLAQGHDRIGSGISQNLRGLLFFDPTDRQDSPHAARIASLTRMTLIGVPQSGHPCGPLLNKIYPLKKILREVASGEPDVTAIRKAMLQVDIAGTPQDPSDDHWLTGALDRTTDPSADPSMVDPKFLVILARSAHENPEALGEGTQRLDRLIDLLRDPRITWAQMAKRRDLALRFCCMTLIKLGHRRRAQALAMDALPPVMAAPFLPKT